jgi:DNA primase
MARIKEQDIDTLRERASIVEVVSGFLRLKKSGGHTFKGLCPFHSEKTPSFTVDASRGLWHCFGCGEGGNIYQFVQKVENLSFPEAVEWLAGKTGFQLTYEEMRPGERRVAGVRARLVEANDAAARFFHQTLFTSPEAEPARRYLQSRGFGKEVAERWLLGYAPGRNRLCRHLSQRGFAEKEIEQADLGRRSERDSSLYDTFRMRIMFPTWNLQGDVVAFGARALGDQQPKYLNSSETPVFSKSRVLFGLNRAKSAIARGIAVVVEGYTDVIALHEAGIAEAVATNGVALSESHFEQLKKFTSRAVLMLDADEAGKSATERTFDIHHRIGLEVLVAPLPAGRDPADVAREDGAEAIQKVIDGARPLMEFKLEQAIDKLPVDTPEARSRAVREAVKVLGLSPDPIARHEHAFAIARRIGVDAEAVHRALGEVEEATVSDHDGGGAPRGQTRSLPGNVKVEREALQLLLTRGEETTAWLGEIDEASFTSPARRELFSATRQALQWDRALPPAELAQELSGGALSLYTELTVGEPVPDDEAGTAPREIFMRLRVFKLEREIKARRDVLQALNPVTDPQRHDSLFTELVGLEAERRDVLRQLQGGP